MADEYVEEQPEEGGIKGALTKQLGPLPVWSWAIIIVGGVLLYRILRGSGASSNGGTVGSTDNTGGGLNQDPFSGTLMADLLAQVNKQGELLGVEHSIDALQLNLNTIQGQLDSAINQRTTLVGLIDKDKLGINAAKDALAQCKTTKCRTNAKAKIAKLQADLDVRNKQMAALNNAIQTLQQQYSTTQTNITSLTLAPPATTTENSNDAAFSSQRTDMAPPAISGDNVPISPMGIRWG